MTREKLKAALVAAAASSILPLTAYAQDTARPAVSSVLDEIVITATKKRDVENVQNVAIAVTAFGQNQLDALNFKDLSSISGLIPNTTLREIGTFKGVSAFNIRGMGTLNSIPSIDPSIGAFVDGVYYGINAGVMFDNFDIESIEVLRGPQGILFGRNVIGGAVLVNTTRPTEELTATFSGAVNSGFRGTGEDYTLSGIVSGPLGTDKLKGKLAAYYNKDEGWFKNAFNGEDYGESETKLFRAALQWDPIEELDFLVRFEYGDQEGEGTAAHSHVNAAGDLGLNADRDRHFVNVNNLGEQSSEWLQVIAETNWRVGFGDGVITNIFGWRDYEQRACLDIDATPATIFNSVCLEFPTGSDPQTTGDTNDQDQISNELRYAGGFGPVEVTAGLYYFTQDIIYNENRSIFGGAVRQSGGGIQDHKVFGVFANSDWTATDKLTVNAGIRYTREKKEVQVASLTAPKPGATIPGFCRVNEGTCPFDFEDSDSWSNIDYKAGLQYQWFDNLLTYGHWSTGFRSGGYNLRNSAVVDLPGPSDEESIQNFELGIKSDPTDRIRLNIAAFLMKAKDLQRAVISTTPLGPSQRIANTADATVKGLEIDGQIQLADNLAFIGSVGFLDAEYDEVKFDLTGDGLVDQADLDLPLPNAPDFTSSASLIHDLDLGAGGTVSTRITYSHRAITFGTNTDAIIPTQDVLDFNVAWVPLDLENWQVSLFGRNVTNDVLFTSDTQLGGSLAGTSTYSTMSKGRQIGLEATFRY